MVRLSLQRAVLLLLLCCVVCGIAAIFSLRLPKPDVRSPEQGPIVCLIGNAPNEDAADRVFDMWSARFPGAYYLWNITSPRASYHSSFSYISGLGSFSEGLEKALKQARLIVPTCDYYFTHDDDLYFTITKSHQVTGLADTLLSVLSKYRPLVASFPWEVGERMHKNLKDIRAEWNTSEVGPLIGFDNGVVLYHASIVDFFIPFAPRGEGGFVGHWTLGAHFLNLFVTMAFRNSSICINTLRYRNTINIDNLSADLRNERITDENGLVHYKAGSRHPYEWPLNNAYKRFLSSGLKCTNCRWGRDLRLEDVQGWQPHVLMRPLNSFQIAQQVASVFHIQHEALRNNSFLARFSDSELQNLKLFMPYSLRINVFSFNRALSFMRLWSSLVRALAKLQCNCTVSIHVHQDYDPKESPSWKEQNSLLQDQHLDAVSFIAHLYSTHQGLRRMILSSWEPQTDDEFCLFLEDDIELADLALHYADSLISQYWYVPRMPWSKLLGISLYRPRYSEVTESSLAFKNPSPLFLYEYPSSWGQVFSARPWSAFLDWEAQAKEPFLTPNSYTNRWPSSNSWKKALLRWMVQSGSVMLYPNIFGNLSLSTNHLDRGTNDKLTTNSTALAAMKAKFTVPLVPTHTPWPLKELPLLDAIPQFDAWGNSVHSVRPQEVSSFDKCTVLMAVCHRVESWKDRVFHFQNATFLLSFVIIWQNCHPNHSAPSSSEAPPVPFPVHIVSRKNSLNNRFLPLLDLSADCIISVDDDFDMPLRNISFAVDTWRGHFWNHLVGFAGFGRNHFWEENSGSWRYSTNGREKFSSLVLPTCLLYHKKYQAMYAKLPAEVLHFVDRTMNCDDILLNFVISNATKSGPVVIDGDVWPVYVRKVEPLGGLWHRPDHFSVRSECLNYFVKVFGHMPLRYTTSYFQLDRNYGSSHGVPPGLRHHRSRKEAPPKS